jgi:ABC-type transporter Mla subunit MlaD
MATLSRTRRPKRRRDQPLARATILRGLLIFAVFLGLTFFALRLYNGVPGVAYKKVFVSVPTVGNLLPHDAVRIGGKRIGQVYSIDLGDDGKPRVRLQLVPGTKLPADTKVAIRANGLLGARFIQILPGKSGDFLANGATISGNEDAFSYGLPEAVDTFDPASRKSIRTIVDQLGAGLLTNGVPLNGLNKDLAVGPRKFGEVAEGILAQDGAAARFIPSLQAALNALEPNKQYNRPFLSHGADAASPFVTERKAVQDTLSKAPATLIAATDGLTRGRPLLASVRELSEAAAVTLPPAPAAFRDLAALMGQAPRPLRDLLPLTRTKLPVAAEGATKVLIDADSKLTPLVNQGINLARPQLKYIGDHACDFINFGAVMRSMTGFGQAGNGPNGRAMAFRLEAVVPQDLREAAGLQAGATFKRVAYEEPCAYLSKTYPSLVGDPLGLELRKGSK